MSCAHEHKIISSMYSIEQITFIHFYTCALKRYDKFAVQYWSKHRIKRQKQCVYVCACVHVRVRVRVCLRA